ncbi:MAG TPA: cytochrome c oxidase subunit 3 [Patescibacteria group bacterium]|jgi:cytochrome o ubiquinol oxidase subunit 3|nr:cytochrome c oxidase subunit 3 [Patescibacteria group bacterium]
MSVSHPLEQMEKVEATRLGFWLYLLSDVMLFSALFATFMILRHNTAGGPAGVDIFSPPYVLLQTMALLISSFTAAVALSAANHRKRREAIRYLIATGVFGLVFLGMELMEFSKLVGEGHTWQVSAFLTGFFTLVGTHGLHITVGLIWLGTFLFTLRKRLLDENMIRKLSLFTLFWHFLDLVWIWIFTIVYMFGVGL